MKTKILIGLIVLIGLGVGGFLVYQNISVPEKEIEEETLPVTEEKIEEEIADWKTYQDEQNKWYEVKYPPNWTVQFGTVGLGSTVTFYDSGTSVFKIWSAPNWDGFLVEEWWDEKDRQDEMTYIKKGSVTVGGVRVLVFQATAEPKEKHYVFTEGPGIYDISAVADEKTTKQILSTFKFIEKESEVTQLPQEEIIEITGKVNVMDNQVELISKDDTSYALRTHPVLVWVLDLSHMKREDYAEFIKGTRDIMERRANFLGVSKVLVRMAQFPTRTKLVIEPMIGPADLTENFIDEVLKLIGKVPLLEFRVEGKITGLTGKHLMRAQLDFDQNTNKPVINLEFNKEGKQIFEDFTTKNIGKELAVFLDGISIYSFIIQDSNPIITGDFTVDETKQLIRFLNVGALPVPIFPLSQQNKINMEELQKLHGKTILVKGYLSGEETIKKTIYVISFETK